MWAGRSPPARGRSRAGCRGLRRTRICWRDCRRERRRSSRHLGRQEAAATILSCLARLSDDRQVVVQMRFLEDVPVAEIARRLEKKETAVYTLCHRGLKSLRELMGSLTQYLARL